MCKKVRQEEVDRFMEKKFHQVFWAAALLSVALVVTAVIVVNGFVQVRAAQDTISVTGSAKEPIESDVAVWNFSVNIRGQSLQAAYAELKTALPKIDAFLTAQGIPASEIAAGAINAGSDRYFDEDQQGRRTEHITYFANRRYTVTSSDIDRLERASRSAGDLIAQGVALDSAPLEYLYTKLAEMRNSLLERATEDAKRRAEAIAKSSGVKIGAVKSARMGVFQITPRNSTMVDDYGMNDTSSRLKDVTAVVGAEFRLK